MSHHLKMFEWLMFRCVGLAVLPLRSDLPPELAAAAAGTWVLGFRRSSVISLALGPDAHRTARSNLLPVSACCPRGSGQCR